MAIDLVKTLVEKSDAAVKAVAGNTAGAASLVARAVSGAAGTIAHGAYERSRLVAGTVDGVAGVVASKAVELADAVKERSPEAVVKRAKVSAFKDGINEGANLMANKVYAYSFALVALSTYVAKCDGEVADTEIAQLRSNLKHLRSDENMPLPVREKFVAIANDSELTFDDVAGYLDSLSVSTLENLFQELDDAIGADGHVSPEEEQVRGEFADYVASRRLREAGSDE